MEKTITNQSLKCRRIHEELSEGNQHMDRISNLADEILIKILSWLPMNDVLKSIILSKRWKDLWKYVDNIVFRHDDSITSSKLIDMVNKIVSLNKCRKINKFYIPFKSDYIKDYGSDIDRWIEYALDKNVDDLLLEFKVQGFGDVYEMPQCTLENCISAVSLKLSRCNVSLSAVVKWHWLKYLWLDYVPLSDEKISNLLLGCPLLEAMELSHFSNFRFLDITSSRLQKLKLETFAEADEDEPNYGYFLEILAPNLKSLVILGNLQHLLCKLVNVSSLGEADLMFHLSYTNSYGIFYAEKCKDMLIRVVGELKNVMKLKIGKWCIRILSSMELLNFPCQVVRWKSLILHTELTRWDLPGIAYVLRRSYYLEMLVIELDVTADPETKLFRSAEFLRSCNLNEENCCISIMSSQRLFRCLKDIKVIDHRECYRRVQWGGNYELTFELQLVQFLLKKAVVLENFEIQMPRTTCDNCSTPCVPISQLINEISSLPRSSSDAKFHVIVSP